MLEGLEASEHRKNVYLRDNYDFRLDAEYFSKENIALLNTIEATSPSLIDSFCYVTDGIHESIDYCQDSLVNLFSATTPRENYFDLSRQVFISEKAHIANPRTALLENDVVISTVGTIGNCAVVNKSVLPANSDRHVGIIRLTNDAVKPRYLSTFLLSKYGRFQTWRESTGNVQPNLFLYRIRKLKIVVPSKIFQQAIEDIVLQAEFKRESAKDQYNAAETLLLETLGLINFKPSTVAVNIKSFKDSFLSFGRIDAEYYQTKYEQFENLVKHNPSGFFYIEESFEIIKSNPGRVLSEYDYIEIGDVNTSNGGVVATRVHVDELPANAKNKAKRGDLIVSKVRPNRGAVSIIECDDSCLVVSGAFTVLREKPNALFKKETLQVLLRINIYREWLLKFNVGTQYPVIRDEDILRMPVPKIDMPIQQKIANYLQESFKLKAQSECLLEIAKRAVEIAIEQDEMAGLAYIENNSNV